VFLFIFLSALRLCVLRQCAQKKQNLCIVAFVRSAAVCSKNGGKKEMEHERSADAQGE